MSGSESTHSDQLMSSLRSIETYFIRFYLFLIATVVLFCVSLSLFGDVSDFIKSVLLTFAASAGAFIASSSVGSLLGFLFGIPKSLQKSNSVTFDSSAGLSKGMNSVDRRFLTNTSLEEISDWLTKIIIGLGLVQFEKIIDYIKFSSEATARLIALGSDTNAVKYAPFYFALIVAGLVTSCLLAYLETRTRLTLLFAGAEEAFDGNRHGRLQDANRPVLDDSLRRQATIAGAAASVEDHAVGKLNRSDIRDADELAGWAAAQARLGRLLIAEDALRDALQRAPDNLDIYMRIAEVRFLRENYAGALEIILEGRNRASDPSAREKLMHRGILTALYLPPPAGFRQSLALSDALIQEQANVDAKVYLWRAAAFGQSYKWLIETEGTKEELKAARDQAFDAVRMVVKLKPSATSPERALLRTMLRPNSVDVAGGNDDLAVFAEDEDIASLVDTTG